eukprot:CAMPEP_0118702748 /NCGR_PEP_ID=MMETSP0800-20121206/18091_1 /TAXON_ID=210618 ORGANISM="Striatella unipunctata, Strain CCMP2910" /NCGR_SAMPLE_ID=MMETSP0800 /ASSEMBLY_ACC=CAM_ASM_000638 /LENGTH=482 /DNA_ID=CAMNT_0006604039 /DNA_START=72 /DNA_END=1520 /DNA_ORIENTATION=-
MTARRVVLLQWILFLLLDDFVSFASAGGVLLRRGDKKSETQGLIDFCLGRSNPAYWIIGAPVILGFQTYHDQLSGLGYQQGDDIVLAPTVCEVLGVSHAAVANGTAEMVRALNENDPDIAYRTNNLGLVRMSNSLFTCLDDNNNNVYSNGYCGIGLGAPTADHARFRPFLDTILGNGDATGTWTNSGNYFSLMDISQAAQDYLEEKTELWAGRDAGIFFLTYFNDRIMDIQMTQAEAQEMQLFSERCLLATSAPVGVPIVFGPIALRTKRAAYVELYRDAIERGIESGRFSSSILASDDILLTSNVLLDAVLFAMLPSLTGVLRGVIGAYLHNLGGINDNVDWTLHSDLGRAIMEAVRVFPPVFGVPYVLDGLRYSNLVGYSGYDRTVFGDDAWYYNVSRFETLDQYRQYVINWADRALPLEGKPETSHVCPGKSLSFNLLLGYLSALDIESWKEGPLGKPTVRDSGAGPLFWVYYKIQKMI